MGAFPLFPIIQPEWDHPPKYTQQAIDSDILISHLEPVQTYGEAQFLNPEREGDDEAPKYDRLHVAQEIPPEVAVAVRHIGSAKIEDVSPILYIYIYIAVLKYFN